MQSNSQPDPIVLRPGLRTVLLVIALYVLGGDLFFLLVHLQPVVWKQLYRSYTRYKHLYLSITMSTLGGCTNLTVVFLNDSQSGIKNRVQTIPQPEIQRQIWAQL